MWRLGSWGDDGIELQDQDDSDKGDGSDQGCRTIASTNTRRKVIDHRCDL